MDIYIYVSIQTSLVRFQRQAVVKDRPDGYVEEYLVAAEDEHHLDEHDGRRPEQAPTGTRWMQRRRKTQGRVMVQDDASHGASEENILAAQNNLAIPLEQLRRHEEAMRIRQGVYSARVKLFGEEHIDVLGAASNYALTLNELERFAEAKSLMRKTMPAARRVLGGNHVLMLMMRQNYALALYRDDGATLDDFREAVNTFEDLARIARRVLGGSHPLTTEIEQTLQKVRAALRARETH